MDLTLQRRSLTAIATTLLVCAGGAGIWSFTDVTAGVEDVARSPVTAPAPKAKIPTGTRPSLATVPDRLSRSLYDPPKEEVAKERVEPAPRPPKTKRLDFMLVGTIIDPDESVAMISDANGKVDVGRIGQTLELSPAGVIVQEIHSKQVTLRHNGADSIVKLQKDFQSSGGGARRPGKNRRRN